MSTLRVLSVLVGAATRTGGPPAFVGGTVRELQRLGAQTTVFSTDLALAPSGLFQRQRRIQSAEVHPHLASDQTRLFRARFPRRLAYSPALARALHAEAAAYDVVHLHNLWQHPQFAGYRAARAAGVPYVVSPHGGLDPYLRPHGSTRKRLTTALWQNAMLSEAALIHVTTPAEEDLIADIAPHVPRAIVPPGIYVEEFARLPSRRIFRERYLEDFDGPVVLFLGRITYKKGIDVLIRAFASARRVCRCRLAIAGPDDEGLAAPLRDLAMQLGVSDDVTLTGPLYAEDRLAALASADVWALSSHTENFGIAVVEAMAAGCLVVISPAVNLAWAIERDRAGIVADLDPNEFGAAILAALTDEQRRRQLQVAARRFAARYDWSVIGPQLFAMYADVAAQRN